MIKVFCDICGKEITGKSNEKLKGKVGRLSFDVLTAIDDVWNGGHVCVECLRKAVIATAEEKASLQQKG